MQIEMTIKGLMVDPITNMPIVILRDKDGQKVLPIWVGIFEANAIALQIENVATARPMTHDLLRNVIQDLKAPIFVEESVIDNAKTIDPSSDRADADRLHKWLDSLDPDDLGKYKM